MDPFRVTLASVAAATLLGGVFVGAYTIIAFQEHPGGGLNESHSSIPAAQDALWQAFQAEEPAYMNEGMRMRLTMYGPGDIEMGGAEARHDPESGDHLISMRFDLEKMSEAYGVDLADDAMLGEDPFGLAEARSFNMLMARKGVIHVVGFMDSNWAWRDHSPSEDEFTLFGMSEEEKGVDMPATIGELEMFLAAEEDLVEFEVSPGTYGGGPSWKVDARFQNETTTGDAVFHFRQSDFAPLHIDMRLTGVLDSDTLSMIREQDPDFPLDDLEMRLVIAFEYGPQEITLPSDLQRIGVTVGSSHVVTDTRHEITITDEHDELVPLQELALHVVSSEPAFFTGPTVNQVFARFHLRDGMEGEDNGYRMTFHDNDGDGYLSPGDQAVIQNPDGFWSNETHTASVLFYDLWAGQYEGAPAAPIGLLLLVAAALGVGARRLRTRRERH